MTPLFSLYISMNVLILIGLIFFYLMFYRNEKAQIKNSNEIGLRLARFILSMSLFLPIFSSFIPKVEKIPPVNLGEFYSFNESVEKIPLKVTEQKNVKVGHLSVAENIQNIDWEYVIRGLLCIGFLWSVFRLLREVLYLNKLILESVVHKNLFGVRVLLSSSISAPFSFIGVRGPAIVMPVLLLEDRKNFSLSLKHELQHIRQKDIYWALGLELIKLFFWWNPAIYFWRNILTEMAEMVCDQNILKKATNNPREYGVCLISVAEASLNNFQPSYASGMASGQKQNKTFLSRRVNMIINGQKGKASISRIILKGVMLFSIIACVGAVTHGQSTESKLKTDPIIQNLVDQILKKGISKAEARSGYAAVSDPNTGVILAASYFKKEGDKFIRQSVEHFIAKPYEPYSLFKPMVASVALERKVMDENTVVNAEGGKINVGGRYFYDWKDFGDVTLADSVAQSSTIGIYRAADAIGEENLLKDLKKFGFGSNEHENIGWDKDGILEMAKGKDQKFNLIYLANGIGNIQVTPIEIMQAYGAIANGGKLLEPRSYSSENVKPKVLRQALSEVTALRMKRILNRVVTEGTGKWAQSSKYTISGKTASGFVDRLKVTEATKNANQAQFIGFAPFDKPKLIVHVIIHEPNGGAHGSKHAAPVVRSILNRVLGYKKIKSDHYASAY